MAVRLNEAYKERYKAAKSQFLSENATFNFTINEQMVFLKFDLFAKRLNKLINMFETIHQFSSLEQHTHINGLEQMIKNFYDIVDDIKRKPYDLLDFSRNQFDRDYLEFNVNVHDLDITLQVRYATD